MSFPEEAVPTELRVQVRELQEEAWPSPAGAGAASDTVVHDPALQPVSMLLVDDTTVVAALDILRKEIVHAGQHYAAGGLSTVVSRRQARGRGNGRRLVSAARNMMITQKLDLGLFTCDRPLQAFYESAGWRLLPGTVLIGGTRQEPFPSDQPGFDKVTMADFFSHRARATEASFLDSRVELFPGRIDKLW
ncbi:GNAT family N-acetyltransferase [Streptomyces sp. NPDC001135]